MIDSLKVKIIVAVVFIFVSLPGASATTRHNTFTDELLREVFINPFPPKRIVSLSPNVTEILFELGLGDKIVGVTKECNYPPAAKKKPKVGDYVNINMELLVSLAPDLIIISAEGNMRRQLERMERLHLPIYTVETKGLESLMSTIKHIGIATGKSEEGEALSKTIADEVASIKASLKGSKRKSVFCAVGIDPLIGAGSNTLIGNVINVCGGDNIIPADGPDYPMINIEELYVKDPEVILLSSMGSEVVKVSGSPELKMFSKLTAAKSGALFIVDADILCRPSYRIVDALRYIAKKIHPENKDFTE